MLGVGGISVVDVAVMVLVVLVCVVVFVVIRGVVVGMVAMYSFLPQYTLTLDDAGNHNITMKRFRERCCCCC